MKERHVQVTTELFSRPNKTTSHQNIINFTVKKIFLKEKKRIYFFAKLEIRKNWVKKHIGTDIIE